MQWKKVPITSEVAGKKYSCRFTAVYGAGQNVWHLSDDRNFYLGRLRQANDRWVFDGTPKTQQLDGMADWFANYLTAWVE